MILDFFGRAIRCPHPRAYPDARAPRGKRFEPCHRNSCVVCAAEKALTLARAISLYPLCQAGVVTLSSFEDRRDAGRCLRRGTNEAFRRIHQQRGLLVPRASVVELSSDGRPHLHVITREPSVPQKAFAEACEKSGMGWSSIQPVRGPAIGLSKYLLKQILPRFGELLVADSQALTSFLELNGNRLINTRGDFWIDYDGTILADSREAMKAARRHRRRQALRHDRRKGVL